MAILDDITPVVLTGGRVEHLARCLASLANGSATPARVIVVDNDPSGASELAFREGRFPPFVDCLSGTIGGYAESRNFGVENVASPFVAFLDDDCLADRWWLERMRARLEQFDAVGGPVLPAPVYQTPRDFSPELNWLVGLSTPMMWTRKAGRVELPNTSNVAFRRIAWEQVRFHEIGGRLSSPADQENYLIGREDAQWWRSMRKAGLRTTIEHRAIVFHDFDSSRYSVQATRSRALADGRAHWRRECPQSELAAAASDVVHYPFRIIEDIFAPGYDYQQVRRKHRTWRARQLALLDAAVDDESCRFTPQDRTALYVRESFNLLKGKTKPAMRQAAEWSHQSFKNIRPLPSPENPPQSITVVTYPFLGDTVMMIPLLEQLKENFPESAITIVVSEAAAPLFHHVDYVDRVVELPPGLGGRNPRKITHAWDAIKSTNPDVIIVTFYHHALPLPVFASTSAPVICWDRDHGMQQQVWSRMASAVVPKSLRKREIAAILDLASPLGIPTRLYRPRITPPGQARERAADFTRELNLQEKNYAAIHLDADENSRKFWPTERYAQLATWLARERGIYCVFTGTRRGRRHFEAMNLSREHAYSLHGMDNSAELAALQQNARICIGVDSGPQHIAQAVGAPTLVMFEPFLLHRWGPLPRLKSDGDSPLPFKTVTAANALADWTDEEHARLAHNEQMLRLTAKEVIQAADELLHEE